MAAARFSTTIDEDTSACSISALHPDIIQTHILTRLDGPTLASTACTSSTLNSLAADHRLWSNICRSTWPSTETPLIRRLVSSYGPFSFFSDSFHLLANTLDFSSPKERSSSQTPRSVLLNFKSTKNDQAFNDPSSDNDRSSHELISAVDIHHGERLIFSKVVETETLSSWFKWSPFRIDLLDPKDVLPTPVKYPETETCNNLGEILRLSWILIDPSSGRRRRRVMNVSSHTAVSVQKHWLSGEVHARFASILPGGGKGTASEYVQAGIVVTLGEGGEGGEVQVREVSLQVEDMDGTHLNGRDSLVILQKGLDGRKVGKRRYEEFLEKKKERKEKKMRAEGTLDTVCVTFGVLGFFIFWLFILCR